MIKKVSVALDRYISPGLSFVNLEVEMSYLQMSPGDITTGPEADEYGEGGGEIVF